MRLPFDPSDAEYERSEASDLAGWAEAEREFSDGPPTREIPTFESMEEVVSERLR